MPSPYATIESQDALWYEQSTYIASHLASMGYGLHATVFIITLQNVLRWQRPAKIRIWWITLLLLLLIFGTINIACSIRFNQYAWIDERNYPGGPSQFLSEQRSRPTAILANISSLIVTFLADSILLYRLMVLWCYAWYIIILPIFFFVGCLVLSILSVIQIVKPGFAHGTNLSLPVWLALMVLNIFLSALITIRLLIMRHTVISGLGRQYAKLYGMIAAVTVEAALPCTILSVILLALFWDKNITQSLFISLFIQLECITPALIILYVITRQNVDSKIPSQPILFMSSGSDQQNVTYSGNTSSHNIKTNNCSEELHQMSRHV